MLGTLFWMFEQLCGEATVVLFVKTALTSTGNWTAHNVITPQLHHWFGRRTNKRCLIVPNEVHIRARIHLP